MNASGLALAMVFPASAQAPVPVGAQFQINTYTTDSQFIGSVAAETDGDFIVVWASRGSFGTDNGSPSAQAQRYASDGSPRGAQFQVNTYTTGFQVATSVAIDANGDFVVVWQSDGSFGTDTSGPSVQGQRYASDGSVRGGEFQINSYTTGFQGNPSVAAKPDGEFLVVWEGYGSSGTDTSGSSIHGQRYASDGSLQGAEFQVNTYTTYNQGRASAAMNSAGDFVVAWNSFGPYFAFDDYAHVQGRRFASDGSPEGAEFRVDSVAGGNQYEPKVRRDDDGDFVVVWASRRWLGLNTSDYSIQGQRYASDGATRGTQFQVDSFTTGTQRAPSLAVDADGDFVVAWQSNPASAGNDTSKYSIEGQRFASDGSSRGAQFQINTYTTNDQMSAYVAAAANGNFVVAWSSVGSFGTDTSVYSIQGQRYRVTAAAPPAVPAMSRAARLALGAVLMSLGAAYALGHRR